MKTHIVKETLEAIKNLSLEDLASADIAASLDEQSSQIAAYPLAIRQFLPQLEECFAALQSKGGAEELTEMLMAAMPVADKNLLDHDLLSKIDVLNDYLLREGEVSYKLTTLMIVASTAINETQLNSDQEKIGQYAALQMQNAKNMRADVAGCKEKIEKKMKLENACEVYMQHLEKVINDEIKKHPNTYFAYKVGNYITGEKAEKKLSFDAKNLSAHPLELLQENKNIPKSIMLAIEKWQAVNLLNQNLKNSSGNIDQTLKSFERGFQKIKPLFEKNRDQASMTFLKKVANVLSLGVSSSFLWRKSAKKMIHDVEKEMPKIKKP